MFSSISRLWSEPSPAQHDGSIQALGQQIASFGPLFDQLAGQRLFFQPSGQTVTDPSAADDQYPFDRCDLLFENRKLGNQVFFFADKVDQIPGPQMIPTRRNDQLLIAHHGGDQRPALMENISQIDQPHTVQSRAGFQVNTDEFDAPVGKVSHVHRARDIHQSLDGTNHFDVRVDDGVDMRGIGSERLVVVFEVGVPQPGQFLGGRGQGVGNQAGDQVHFVGIGDGQHDLRLTNASRFEDGGAASRTDDRLDIDTVRKPLQRFGTVVDHHHVLALQRQSAGDVKSHLAGTDDNDFHRSFASRIKVAICL